MAIKISHKRSVKHAKNFNSFNFHHQLASSSQSHFRLRIVHFKNKQKQNQALQQNELYQKLCHVSTLTFSTFQKETTPLGLKQYYGLWIFTMSIFSNSAYRQCYCKKKKTFGSTKIRSISTIFHDQLIKSLIQANYIVASFDEPLNEVIHGACH